MTDECLEKNDQAAVTQKPRVSIVWLLPLVAALIGIWLIYKSIVEAGLEVTIAFPSGDSIIANETQVRFEGVLFGVVKSVVLSEDLEGVLAKVELDPRTAGLLQNDTEFWLVEPELSLSRVAGLDTLLTGKYITFQLGEKTGGMSKAEISQLKASKFHYQALAAPPPKSRHAGGLSLTLSSSDASSMTRGTPILYQKLTVGSVEGIRLAEDGRGVLVDIHIEAPYVHLIEPDTRFWNVSGLHIGGGLGNIKVNMESISSLMIGGITFSAPGAKNDHQPVEWGEQFRLYPDQQAAFSKGVTLKINFDVNQEVLVGTEIKFKGLSVGEVTAVELSEDLKMIHATATINKGMTTLPRKNSAFWLVKPELGLANTRHLETLLTGKYIAVRPGSGPLNYHFEGLAEAPINKQKSAGLNIILSAPSLGSLKEDVGVFYRDIKVGRIKGYELATNAQRVLIYVNVDEQYRALVHENTQFWNVSGIGVDFGLFSGAKIRANSVESLLEGGVAFATPNNEDMGEPASDGTEFVLFSEAKDEWQAWQPNIKVGEASQP